jgi:hypothetical protein
MAEEGDRKQRHGCSESAEDGAVDVHSGPFCRRARGRPACYSASFLRREIKHDRARSWWRRTGQTGGDI